MSSKGQVVIPADLRRELGFKAGSELVFSRQEDKLVISRPDWAAIEALCGKYAGLFLEEGWISEKLLEREREDRKLAEL
jgi:AbrB family looped-hinge helix DNA binding protein